MRALNWWRILLAAVFLANASFLAAADEDDDEEKSPLTEEEKKLAQKYAKIEAWEGHFMAEESAGYRGTGGGAYSVNAASYDKTTRGTFRLNRSSEDTGQWDPARGMFEWHGDGTIDVTNDERKEQWMRSGDGFEWHEQSGGNVGMKDFTFYFWLHERAVSFGPGAMAKAFTTTVTGRRVETVTENAHLVQKTKSLNKTTPEAGGAVMPLRGLGLPGQAEKPAELLPTILGGPGVLVFTQAGPVATAGWTDNYSGFYNSRVVLTPIYDDAEVEVTITGDEKFKDYNKWMPRGNIAKPDQPEGNLSVKARLIPKTAKAEAAPPKVKSFRFFLEDVSREPGVCMNWPRFGADGDSPPDKDPKPDIRFNRAGGAKLSDEDLKAELAPIEVVEGGKKFQAATAQVDSYDFGGYATLRVICVLQDGREIAGILKQDGERLAMIPVPWRTAGSKIAKAWKDRSGLDREDLDPEPVGDGNLGDGFSNYEEYRGFVENRGHIRTKPGEKDIFIYNPLGKKAQRGIFLYTDITKLRTHYELKADEMPKSRRMNVNRSADSPRTCAAAQFQHGLVLATVDGGDRSFIDVAGDLFRPQFVSSVKIHSALFAKGYEGVLESIIAHELSHASGVRHHGENDDYVVWLRMQREVNGRLESWFEERPMGFDEETQRSFIPPTPGAHIRIFDADNQEISPEESGPFDEKVIFLGHYGQQHSGDTGCVMRYFVAGGYVLPGRPRDRFVAPRDHWGMALCSSGEGTDFNEEQSSSGVTIPARFSDATKGNCSHQICVRDDVPAPVEKKIPVPTPTP
ncbi:MAG: hypothetical protein QM760_03705 [Nibricoccus sp.]